MIPREGNLISKGHMLKRFTAGKIYECTLPVGA